MANTFVSVIRSLVLVFTTLLALAVIGLAIHAAVVLIPFGDFPSWAKEFDFLFVGWIAGALTVISCPLLLIMGLAWRNGPLTKNVAELPIFGVLLILWLVIGARANNYVNSYSPTLCTIILPRNDIANSPLKVLCKDIPAVKDIAFTTFAILLAYCLFTIVLCVVAKSRDSSRKVWLLSASQANYFETPETKPQPPMNNMVYAQYPGPYPYPAQGVAPPMMIMNGAAPGQAQMPYVVYVPQPMPMEGQPPAGSLEVK
ncbi:hypothetical protein V5O48_007308 [Marasmius crinis-equi]|uniref:MARVEL domain-containing protein n=1 Tax=Marasmius crinis-equi TaxID=585013 RepID=A0ABR3FHC5_9AGAR